ncbi:glycogen synthase GlgA [Caulobacter sp. D4A]|uniref:glycogen synthase GlgA n=1 Tax=unclassified Caulobacter TaxID=2648921 RepID=UPI000D73A86E|nr:MULTISPECIES: glycogen synthase GlgA [unclassified Caulobacter]PXA95129.1 glycogen synthase GlgA [Caulobacter sp. D5]PXA95721.1 glycogen synthase GlgA [Caulobacter sp. D4A]
MSAPSILSVAAEIFPLIKTGGLADVVGALPLALAREGVKVVTLVPGYPAVKAALETPSVVHRFSSLMGAPARLLRGRAGALDLLVIDAPHLYDRPGNPYLQAPGVEWPDNGQRFAALAKVAAEIGLGLLADYQPDVIQAHDWHAGLTPAYLHYAQKERRLRAPPVVLSIHNLAFQGLFPASLRTKLGLPAEAMAIDGVEYWGDIGFLKAGIQFADQVTTVSPSYAAEITTEEGGMGLGGLLKARAKSLVGILNGIDADVWNPETDTDISVRYTAETLERRAINKLALQAKFGLRPDAEAPLFGILSRLTDQKGVDLLLGALPVLFAEGAQLIVCGQGEPRYEAAFSQAAERYPGAMGRFLGYREDLAHLIQAGADAILAPSRFEPCGLTQLCAMRYGAIPVVSRTGGLSDTIIDANTAGIARSAATGVQFAPATQDMLEDAIRRTCALYRDPVSWRRVQLNAMASDSSWRVSAAEYAALFARLAARPVRAPVQDATTTAMVSIAPASPSEPRSFAAYEAGEPSCPGPAPRRAPARRTSPRSKAATPSLRRVEER